MMTAVYESVGPPLNRHRLAERLREEGMAERAYSLDGEHKEDAIVIDNRPVGWVVFYSERGGEHVLGTYSNEADACADLLCRVLEEDWNRFELVAGPALATEADLAFDQWLDDHGLSRESLVETDWRRQDSPWKRDEPDYRRYWVRIKRTSPRST